MNIFKNFKYGLQDTAFVRHISFLGHWKNFFFLCKYPFWKAYNRGNGKFCGYAFTEYDSIDSGWRKAFGKELSEDIKIALYAETKRIKKETGKKPKLKDIFVGSDIKEKGGELVLSASTTDVVYEVLSRYELLSLCYCRICGKPARYNSGCSGYEQFLCEDCLIKYFSHFKEIQHSTLSEDEITDIKEKCRLTEKDIPKITFYENGESISVDLKKKYSIDFMKAGDLQ